MISLLRKRRWPPNVRIAEIFPVDLPAQRDYAQTMASAVLADLGGRARALLGATAHTE